MMQNTVQTLCSFLMTTMVAPFIAPSRQRLRLNGLIRRLRSMTCACTKMVPASQSIDLVFNWSDKRLVRNDVHRGPTTLVRVERLIFCLAAVHALFCFVLVNTHPLQNQKYTPGRVQAGWGLQGDHLPPRCSSQNHPPQTHELDF